MSTEKYQQLKESPTATGEGLEYLPRIWWHLRDDENVIDIMAILVRARGRVIADLIKLGVIQQDSVATEANLTTRIIDLAKKAEQGKMDAGEALSKAFEFIRRHGE